ncbi:hypothetical protein NDU88_000759 [Pleurodeles waltl]|uniref:Uncharacterized protein n=1 Tax=Pleurodeles waltl TaxID=8319 RepID=A0AAV7P969_PLEWA|nr:hypothetical protein NDU88_000759 [Pleurodeles waltl]
MAAGGGGAGQRRSRGAKMDLRGPGPHHGAPAKSSRGAQRRPCENHHRGPGPHPGKMLHGVVDQVEEDVGECRCAPRGGVEGHSCRGGGGECHCTPPSGMSGR